MVEKQLQHELFRQEVRNLLTATVQYMKNSRGLFYINSVKEQNVENYKRQKTIKHELFRYKVSHLLTATVVYSI